MFRGIALCFLLAVSFVANAQYESAVSYMDYLSTIEADMGKDYMSYMSAMAHTNSAKKMEKRRAELIATVKEGLQKVSRLKAFGDDVALRSAYKKYLSILQAVLSEDYSKIVDMEEIAEQSYDKMEAYLLAQEKANEKLHVATDSLRASYETFAQKNHVKLVDTKDKVSEKLSVSAAVMNYYYQVYLVHFKSAKQEGYMIQALNNNDINGIEQSRSTLVNYATEGLEKLKSMKPYNGDYSIVVSCRKFLEFLKDEGENKMSGITDYLIKKDEFTKFKREYDSKPSQKRDRNDVDDYNTFVNEMNKLGDNFNKINDQMNRQRSSLTDAWNTSISKFLDSHIPQSR